MAVIAKVEKGRNLQYLTTTIQDVYKVTKGRKFKLESLIITNISGDCEAYLFDAASNYDSGLLIHHVVAPATATIALNKDDLYGSKEAISAISAYATVSGRCYIHVGGDEY